jgi:hypothetical protein
LTALRSFSVKKLTQDEIDEIVVAEADDMEKWTDPIRVKPKKVVVLHIAPKTIERARNIARRKRLKNYEVCLNASSRKR